MANTKEVKKKTIKTSTVIAADSAKSTKKGGELSTEKRFQYLYNRIQTGKKVDGQGYNYMKNEYVKPIFDKVNKAKLTQLDVHLRELAKFIYVVEGLIYDMEHPATSKKITQLEQENAKLKEQLEKATKKTKVAKETN